MRLELPLIFDELFGFRLAVLVLFDAGEVKHFPIYFDAVQDLIQKSLKIILVPDRSCFASILEHGADFALDVLAVYEQDGLHRQLL